MTGPELAKYLENLFRLARLHGWCDEVHKLIAEFEAPMDDVLAEEFRSLLKGIVGKTEVDKEEAILSMILLRRMGVPEKELYEYAYRGLKSRLYLNDFRFLIQYFFDKKVPLPRSLVYDITEKLFFSLEDVYDKIVKDFTRVPFRSAEPVVFFLLLQNCRVDLNTQNKELICIILTHIEIKLPDPILDDIVFYLDENATLRDNWLEQRKTIEFSREQTEEIHERVKKKKDERGRPSSLDDRAPILSEPAGGVDAGPLSVRIPDYSASGERAEPAPPRREREEQSPKSPEIKPREGGETLRPLPGPGPDYDIRFPSTKPGHREERSEILGSERRKKSDVPETADPGRLDYEPSGRRGKSDESGKAPEKISGQGSEKSGMYQEPPPSTEKKEDRVMYDDFIEAGSERGIFLSRLNRERWKKALRKGGKLSGTDTFFVGAGKAAGKFFEKAADFFKKRKVLGLILGVLLLLALLLFTVSVSRSSVAPPAKTEVLAQSISSSLSTGPPAALDGRSERPILRMADDRILWQVRKGDSFYGLYIYLRSNPSGIDSRLQNLSNLPWNVFLVRMTELNPPRLHGPTKLDVIFPSDTYVLFSK